MTPSPSLLQNTQDGICTLSLNRPEKHNALNPELIVALHQALHAIQQDDTVRALILRAEGPNFCAGADIHWMKETARYSSKQNEKDALHLAELLYTLNTLPKPTIALVQGRAMGGGAGLIACCDMVVAAEDARFCFSEVKLGLIPATIAPYVIQRIGYAAARRCFVSAEELNVADAHQLNLIDKMATGGQLLETGNALAQSLKANGPEAMGAAKQLVNDLAYLDRKTLQQTAKLLAAIRASKEAQEGLQAFLEKRSPSWRTD